MKRIIFGLLIGAMLGLLTGCGTPADYNKYPSAWDIHNQFPEHSGGWLLPAPTTNSATIYDFCCPFCGRMGTLYPGTPPAGLMGDCTLRCSYCGLWSAPAVSGSGAVR